MATRDITDPTVRSDLNTSLAYNCPWPNKQDKMNQPRQWGPREEGLVCSSGHVGWNLVPRFPPPGLFSGLVGLFTASSLLPGNWAPSSESCRLWIPQTLYPSVSPMLVTSPWPLPHLSFHRGKGLFHGHLRPLKKIQEGHRARPHVNGLPPTKPPAAPAQRTLFRHGQTPQ